MKMTNSFHRTEIEIEAVETGFTQYGERYAEFNAYQLKNISMQLCGIASCCCHKFESRCHDDNGKDYVVMITAKNPAAVALGRMGGSVKSAKKSAASAANGAKGGRPRKSPAPA